MSLIFTYFFILRRHSVLLPLLLLLLALWTGVSFIFSFQLEKASENTGVSHCLCRSSSPAITHTAKLPTLNDSTTAKWIRKRFTRHLLDAMPIYIFAPFLCNSHRVIRWEKSGAACCRWGAYYLGNLPRLESRWFHESFSECTHMAMNTRWVEWVGEIVKYHSLLCFRLSPHISPYLLPHRHDKKKANKSETAGKREWLSLNRVKKSEKRREGGWSQELSCVVCARLMKTKARVTVFGQVPVEIENWMGRGKRRQGNTWTINYSWSERCRCRCSMIVYIYILPFVMRMVIHDIK